VDECKPLLAGSVQSNVCFCEEIETLEIVKDIFEGYGMAVHIEPRVHRDWIEPRVHRAWYQRLML